MSQPKVSIVILAYLESNAKYFDACLRSVENLDYPKHLLDIVVVSPWYYSDLYRVELPGQNFSASVNRGVSSTDKSSEHILLLSDDTIITKDALKNMVGAAGDSDCIMGPISNCDNHWKYVLHFPHLEANSRYYRIEDVSPTEMMNAQSYYPAGILTTETLCFYAFLIPRSTWNKVGLLDEQFNMGYEDSDYCARAKGLSIPLIVTLNALIYHAGGASEEIITEDMRESNLKLFKEKWSSN